jgi:hypothetical protein
MLEGDGHLGASSSSVALAGQNNMAYVGPVQLGTPMQGNSSSMFVYDSGSGYLTVTAESCITCEDEYYNFAESETSK